MKKRCVGMIVPDEVDSYIKEKAKQEHRSLANLISLIVIDYYNYYTSDNNKGNHEEENIK